MCPVNKETPSSEARQEVGWRRVSGSWRRHKSWSALDWALSQRWMLWRRGDNKSWRTLEIISIWLQGAHERGPWAKMLRTPGSIHALSSSHCSVPPGSQRQGGLSQYGHAASSPPLPHVPRISLLPMWDPVPQLFHKCPFRWVLKDHTYHLCFPPAPGLFKNYEESILFLPSNLKPWDGVLHVITSRQT